MKFTKHYLKKLEDLIKKLDYTIRYEKGSFQSGYCVVEQRRVIVVNKFFDVEARINTLLDIIHIVEVNDEHLANLDNKELKFFHDVVGEPEPADEES